MKYAGCLVLLVCLLVPPASAASEAATPTPSFQQAASDSISYINSGSFDKRLSKILAEDPDTVTVTFPVPFDTDSIPERIDNWLTMVEDHDGIVDLKPEVPKVATRGLIGEAMSLVKSTYGSVKKKRQYRHVKNYDAIVYYEAESGEVTRIVFTRKST